MLGGSHLARPVEGGRSRSLERRLYAGEGTYGFAGIGGIEQLGIGRIKGISL